MPVNNNAALYSLISNVFGGNQVNFNLPDFRGRLPLGYNPNNQAYPLTNIGNTGGNATQTLTLANMPIHNHAATLTGFTGTGSFKVSANQATESVAGTNGANTLGAPYDPVNGSGVPAYVNDAAPAVQLVGLSMTASGGSVTVGNNGGSQPFSIQNPYLVVNYIIATLGIYPTRD
jgi:microcystin-dependent protein